VAGWLEPVDGVTVIGSVITQVRSIVAWLATDTSFAVVTEHLERRFTTMRSPTPARPTLGHSI
jgi:hypothetical protein